jgi:hypothetical protein
MDNSNASNSQWNNNDRAERLESLYREGLSFSLIAADIGVTRAAAIGKAHRMNLPRRVVISASKPHPGHKKRAEPRKRVRHKTAPPMPLPKPVVVIDPGRDYRCDILGLTATTCRYPTWGMTTPHEQRLYCGRPGASVKERVPYCAQHCQLCGIPRQL